MTRPWYPAIDQYVHPEVSRAIKGLYDNFYTAQRAVDGNTRTLDDLTRPGGIPDRFLHTEDKNFIQKLLQSDGSHPINVTNLLGVLSQPQRAMAPVSSSSSTSPITPSGTPTNGQLQIQGGQLFYYDSSTSSWVAVSALAVALEDSHANRVANFPPANYPQGTVFFERDRNAQYINIASTSWLFMVGVMIDVIANRPVDLGVDDTHFLFLATDATELILYWWDGAAWQSVTPAMGGAYPAQDVTGTFPNPRLNTTGVTAATYGDGTHVAQITVDARGRLSSASSVVITGAAPTGTAGGDLTGTFPNPTVAQASGDFPVTGDIKAITAGKGLQIKTGVNSRIGTGTLVGGTLTVANTSVTATTVIFVTDQGGGVAANIGSLYVSSRINGTSFTVTSTNPIDTSNFAYLLVESI